MLMKKCANSQCGRLIPYGMTYCADCKEIADKRIEERKAKQRKNYAKNYDKKREKKYVEFYHSKVWKRLKAAYAAAKGYRCERCGAIAEQVHHKQHIQTPEGWARRLDWDNLELLCIRCHNKEHERFRERQARRGQAAR